MLNCLARVIKRSPGFWDFDFEFCLFRKECRAGEFIRSCSTEFIKHELPKFYSPTGFIVR